MADASNRDSVEIWKPVPGWEGLYDASSEGRVRSLDKTITATSRWGTPQMARLVRQRWRGGEQQKIIASDMGLSTNTVGRIVNGQHWTG